MKKLISKKDYIRNHKGLIFVTLSSSNIKKINEKMVNVDTQISIQNKVAIENASKILLTR